MTNVTKRNGIWAHFVPTGYFPTLIQLSRPIQKDDVQIETVCCIFKPIRINWLSINVTGISGTMITMPDTAYVSIIIFLCWNNPPGFLDFCIKWTCGNNAKFSGIYFIYTFIPSLNHSVNTMTLSQMLSLQPSKLF